MDGSDSAFLSRRDVLSTVAGASLLTLAGCIGDNSAVKVLSAGSLANTFEDHIGPAFQAATDIAIHGEYYGANAVMRMVEEQTKHPDVIVSADSTLLRDRLYHSFTDWDVEFASNSLGIGYNSSIWFGERLEAGEPWYELALDANQGDLSIGDPNLDPLGYRAVQAFDLAESEHEIPDFRERMLNLVYTEPDEPQLMAGVESGARAAAIVYRNMAVDHDMPFFEFPDAYNFANPELADHDASVQYTTDEAGDTVEGRPILYNATVNAEADHPDAGYQLIQFLIDHPDMLVEAGLTVSDSLPRGFGEVPEELTL
jgi:molybdate/tungstate transport system substrate-binding protein